MEARLFIGGNYVYWIILFYGGSGKGLILVQSMNRIAKKRITPTIVYKDLQDMRFATYTITYYSEHYYGNNLVQTVTLDDPKVLSILRSLSPINNLL